MRKYNRGFFVTGTLAIIILAVHPLAGLTFGDTSATEPAPYSFISVDIPNSSGELGFTILADINDKGDIVARFTVGERGILLDRHFRPIDIQCSGAAFTVPISINKHGEVSGHCFTGKIRGFFRNEKGKYTFLDFPGATLTEASETNDDGQVVGDYLDNGGRFHGFFWDAGLFLTFDVPFPEATSTAATGINNVGQIVGFYDDNGGGTHGFLYDSGTFTSFVFPRARRTLPSDINDHGQIVGAYVDSDGVHGILLEDDKFSTIDVPFPGVIQTQAEGINNRGQIVGGYLDNNSNWHGFIATPKSEPKRE